MRFEKVLILLEHWLDRTETIQPVIAGLPTLSTVNDGPCSISTEMTSSLVPHHQLPHRSQRRVAVSDKATSACINSTPISVTEQVKHRRPLDPIDSSSGIPAVAKLTATTTRFQGRSALTSYELQRHHDHVDVQTDVRSVTGVVIDSPSASLLTEEYGRLRHHRTIHPELHLSDQSAAAETNASRKRLEKDRSQHRHAVAYSGSAVHKYHHFQQQPIVEQPSELSLLVNQRQLTQQPSALMVSSSSTSAVMAAPMLGVVHSSQCDKNLVIGGAVLSGAVVKYDSVPTVSSPMIPAVQSTTDSKPSVSIHVLLF